MNTVGYKKVADFFNALSHPIRVEMVAELLKGKKCVSDMRELLEVNQPNVSQHLSLLRFNDIVDWCQEGKRKCYFLKNTQLIKDIFKVLEKNKFYNFE
ncbi:MAG: metalloregulator ArsR/SmtB family transcription factor [Candidatus Saelkia tenebricola]|nr:metalloregulator ArsR/SmtB family transcription factor [Candidatus Saelkia tenebricola]